MTRHALCIIVATLAAYAMLSTDQQAAQACLALYQMTTCNHMLTR